MKIGMSKRHEMPVDEYIWEMDIPMGEVGIPQIKKDIQDFFENHKVSEVEFYISGYTPAVIEVVGYCCRNNIDITLYSFDRETGNYFSQNIF